MSSESSFIQPSIKQKVVEGLGFILDHFEPPIWPRKISTHASQGWQQALILNKEEALTRFKADNYLDCRISAYPDYTQWNGINRQPPNIIFIDEDQSSFKSKESLDRAHNRTLKTIDDKLGGDAHPSGLWSGNGYHTYLPIKAFVLESEGIFNKFENPSMKFLRFAEQYLSNNKADSFHSNTLSFRNCMLRIPGSHNSECVLRNNGIADNTTEVKIIQRWDGKRPAINWLLRDFRRYLIQEKIENAFNDSRSKRTKWSPSSNAQTTHQSTKWLWVETLLETPIHDHRKYSVWRILAPYFMNIKKLSYDESFKKIKDWLGKCNSVERLDFNLDQRLKYDLRSVGRYLPISFSNLKSDNKELHGLISNIVTAKHHRNA